MNKKLIGFLATLVFGLLAFFLTFGGPEGFRLWWLEFSNGSTWLPFSPYNNRVEDESKLKHYEATYIVIEDQSLFWKGKGTVVQPILNSDSQLEELIISSQGSGYSSDVEARVAGAGASDFELGKVTVLNGGISKIEIIKTGKWYDSPRVFCEGDDLPYSGTAQKKHRNGQLMDKRKYLLGELHGKWSRWKDNGIPLFEKDYLHGKKHGTHMEWYGRPIDPKDYKSGGDHGGKEEKETYVSLWVEVNEKAIDEFKGKQASQQEKNEWIVQTYQYKGGSFAPKLLEHYEDNQRHGLFEKYDNKGNKISKDEYIEGKRVKHKVFDPGG